MDLKNYDKLKFLFEIKISILINEMWFTKSN